MSKRRNKTVLGELKAWAIDNCITNEEELANRFYKCIEEPDPIESVKLIKRQKFNRFVASICNKDGIRIAFPVKGRNGIKAIHIIPGTSDLKAVSEVEDRLTHNSAGNDRTRKPVNQYKNKLIEQLSLFSKKVNE